MTETGAREILRGRLQAEAASTRDVVELSRDLAMAVQSMLDLADELDVSAQESWELGYHGIGNAKHQVAMRIRSQIAGELCDD